MNNIENAVASPFKFLDAYEKKDRGMFFGREKEIDELYSLVKRNRIVIIYGKMGTGKTSLVRCGLANCFDDTDWFSLYLRRGSNYLIALSEALKEVNPGAALVDDSMAEDHSNSNLAEDNPKETPLVEDPARYITLDNSGQDKVSPGDELHASPKGEHVSEDAAFQINAIIEGLVKLIKQKLRPLYLIFDQFEEMLILGNETERNDFINLAKRIMSDERLASCNLLFTIREEFIGFLEPVAKAMPGFMDARLHLGLMDEHRIKNVILDSGSKFNISFREGAIDKMYEILSDQPEVSLPYLQVYLDQLWKADLARTYPGGYDGIIHPPMLEFTVGEIEESGMLRDVLQRFLSERLILIKSKAIEKASDVTDTPADATTIVNALDNILDALVSKEGTKAPLEITREKDGFKLAGSATETALTEVHPDLINILLTGLEANRIIRADDKFVELAHDKLAELIFQKRTQEIRHRDEAVRLIESTRKDNKIYLTDNEIAKYEDISQKLDSEALIFLEKSKQANKNKRLYRNLLTVILPLAAFFITIIAIQFYNVRDKYRKLSAANFFSQTMDSISNKKQGLVISRYLYNLQTDSLYQNALAYGYFKLFKMQEIQSALSNSSITVPLIGRETSDFAISDDGKFFALLASDSTGKVILYDERGKSIKSIDSAVSYMYFIAGTHQLLTVLNFDRNNSYDIYSQKFTIYDCVKKKYLFAADKDSVIKIGGRFLYPKSRIGHSGNNPNDSYRIRYTSSRNIIVPVLQPDKEGKLRGMVLLYDGQGRERGAIPSDYTISNSYDSKQIMTGYRTPLNRPVVEIHDANMTALKTVAFKDASFGDFTKSGASIFIRGDSLFKYDPVTKGITAYAIGHGATYAYMSDDQKYILLEMGNEQYAIYNTATRKKVIVNEKLAGVDFQHKMALSSKSSSIKNGPDSLYLRDFAAKEIATEAIKDGILQTDYNASINNLLLLDNKYRLLLFDTQLKVKTVLQLSPNDLFGFSGNGKNIFYIRDTSMNILTNSPTMVNLTKFADTEKWLDTSAKFKNYKVNSDIIKKYDLPGRFLSW